MGLVLFNCFSVRWYPESISQYWYADFVNTFNEDIDYMYTWVSGVPFGFFILHAVSVISRTTYQMAYHLILRDFLPAYICVAKKIL